MELKISEWRSEGLRCPDGIVNLKKNGFKRFNFVFNVNTFYLNKIIFSFLFEGFCIWDFLNFS